MMVYKPVLCQKSVKDGAASRAPLSGSESFRDATRQGAWP